MQKNRNTKNNSDSVMTPKFAGTDPQQVKQQIQEDDKNGQGAMTSSEAGAMRAIC